MLFLSGGCKSFLNCVNLTAQLYEHKHIHIHICARATANVPHELCKQCGFCVTIILIPFVFFLLTLQGQLYERETSTRQNTDPL